MLSAFPAIHGSAGDIRHRSLSDLDAMQPPELFEHAGRKGSLQVFGSYRPKRPVLVRVGFHGADKCGPFVWLVSRPPRDAMVNPHGWNMFDADDPDIRARFLTYGSTHASRRLIAGDAMRDAVVNLHDELDRSPLTMLMSRGILQVSKWCGDRPPRDHLRLLHRVLGVLECMSGVTPRGAIGRIDDGPPPALAIDGSVCQVCSEPLTMPLAVCEGCITPHHLECWEYVGGCSTYACLRHAYRVVEDARDLVPEVPELAAA